MRKTYSVPRDFSWIENYKLIECNLFVNAKNPPNKIIAALNISECGFIGYIENILIFEAAALVGLTKIENAASQIRSLKTA